MLGTLEEPPLGERSFDVVVTAFTIHHMFDPRAFFDLVRRVLAPGRRFFLLDCNAGGWAIKGGVATAIRIATSPARFLLRTKNRAVIAGNPLIQLEFNPAHKLRGVAELEKMIEASGLRSRMRTSRGGAFQWVEGARADDAVAW